MNNRELEAILQGDVAAGPIFGSVFASNQLPEEISYPTAIVINTGPNYGPGEHWVAAYFTHDGEAEYFDSYGLPPTGSMKKFVKRCAWNTTYNATQLQGLLSSTCGHYCLFYLLHRCRGVAMDDIVKMFGKNLQKNDRFVEDFIEDFID